MQDVELVLFELDDGPSNLPDKPTQATLRDLADQHQLTYTVHLPLDLHLGPDGAGQHVSLVKAQRVIECTRGLDPWAYVLHLDGRAVRVEAGEKALRQWTAQAIRALEMVAPWAGGADRLAVENKEAWPRFHQRNFKYQRLISGNRLFFTGQLSCTYPTVWLDSSCG